MKKTLIIILIALFTNCTYIREYSKPTVLLNGDSLNITNFDWSYGTIRFDQFNGDFDKLDKKVYDLLKDKSGACKVYIQQQDKDKYGNQSSTMEYIGDIDINELNKFQSFEYWQKDSGIRHLLYKKYVNTDSTKITSSLLQQPLIDSTSKLTVKASQTYGFSTNMLYPLKSDRASLDSNQYAVDGIITDANFNAGAMRVKTQQGEEIDVQFYPTDAGSEVQNNLRLAIKVGNKISSICARAGASNMDLVSCEIIEP